MKFEWLFHHCLKCDEMSHEEEGKRVTLKRTAGETVLFFTVDGKPFDALHGNNTPRCDLLVARKQRNREGANLLFVELKGSDLGKAVQQLGKTIDLVRNAMDRAVWDATRKAALVVMSGGSPPDQKDVQKKFLESRQMSLLIKSGIKKNAVDIRQYLE